MNEQVLWHSLMDRRGISMTIARLKLAIEIIIFGQTGFTTNQRRLPGDRLGRQQGPRRAQERDAARPGARDKCHRRYRAFALGRSTQDLDQTLDDRHLKGELPGADRPKLLSQHRQSATYIAGVGREPSDVFVRCR